jgi:hypothetical protein
MTHPCTGRLCETKLAFLCFFRAMKCAGLPMVSLLVALLLSLPSAVSSATCIGLPPLKPIHRICGVVFFPSGDRIANAKVMVLQDGKEIAVQETNENGKFSFDDLKAGKYEIQVQVKNLPVAATEVVLVRPEAKAKQEIAVNMSLNGCSTFSLVNPKKFEAGLNQVARLGTNRLVAAL